MRGIASGCTPFFDLERCGTWLDVCGGSNSEVGLADADIRFTPQADIQWAGSSAKSWASKFGGYKAQTAHAGVEGERRQHGAARSWE